MVGRFKARMGSLAAFSLSFVDCCVFCLDGRFPLCSAATFLYVAPSISWPYTFIRNREVRRRTSELYLSTYTEKVILFRLIGSSPVGSLIRFTGLEAAGPALGWFPGSLYCICSSSISCFLSGVDSLLVSAWPDAAFFVACVCARAPLCASGRRCSGT